MKLTWWDECDGALGAPPNPMLWGLSTWSPDSDLQAYTISPANAFHNGEGNLVIKTFKQDSGAKHYTSARLMSRGGSQPMRFTSGCLITARIKVPTAAGVWPAFWLTGDDNLPESGWPRCGEIDVMEYTTAATWANLVHQGTHNPNITSPSSDIAVGVVPVTGNWGAGFHVYACLWLPDEVRFFVDEVQTGTVTRDQVRTAGGTWQLAHRPMSLVLNTAVGGWGGGTPDQSWTEQSLLVDWVRVYA